MSSLVSQKVEVAGAIAEVVLLGPGKGNAMGPDFWRETAGVFGQLDTDPNIRAIIVRGEGSHFSYGLDLFGMAPELMPIMSGGATERTALLAKVAQMQGAFRAIENCRKPVIAAVSGYCIGGALDMISACDVRLCSKDARFSLREIKVGMVADLGSLQRLPRIIGEGNTRELAFTGKDIDAARALRIGLVGEVYETTEELIAAARAMAAQIALNSPLVLRGIKTVMEEQVAAERDRGLRNVGLWNAAFLPSEDLGEAFAAFSERRPPNFKGR